MVNAEPALEQLRHADRLLADGDAASAAAARERAAELLHVAGLTTASLDAERGLWHLGHEAAGPAGAATLRLPGGAILSVDLADPSCLVTLTLRAGAPDAGDLAARIVGDAAGALVQTTETGGDWEIVPFDAAGGPAFAALGRLALLGHLRDTHEEEDAAWPLWAAEAAVLWARTGLPAAATWARAEAATCPETVLAVAESPATSEDLRARLRALLPELLALASGRDAAVLRRAEQALRDDRHRAARPWHEGIATFLGELGAAAVPQLPALSWSGRTRGTPTSTPRSGERPDGPAATLPLSPYHTSRGLSGRRAHVYWDPETGELELYCTTTAAGAAHVQTLWVRAFQAPDYAFLASAPLALDRATAPGDAGERLALTRLALPPGLAHEEVLLDITDRPAEPPPDSRLGRIARAVAAGHGATTARRAGLDESAAELWTRSAALWAAAGDTRQQAIAEAYAAQARGRPGGAGARPSGEPWRVTHHPAAVDPFVAEMGDPADLAPDY